MKQSTIGRSGTAPARGAGAHHREQHRVEVLHVDRAAAPDVAVLDLPGERVDLPVLGRGRYDVEVPVQQQRALAAGLSAPLRHQRRAAAVELEQLGLDPDLVEQPGDVLGGLALARPGLVAVVAGVDPDQVATQVDDLAGRVVGRVVRRCSCSDGPGHAPILTPRAGPLPM